MLKRVAIVFLMTGRLIVSKFKRVMHEICKPEKKIKLVTMFAKALWLFTVLSHQFLTATLCLSPGVRQRILRLVGYWLARGICGDVLACLTTLRFYVGTCDKNLNHNSVFYHTVLQC